MSHTTDERQGSSSICIQIIVDKINMCVHMVLLSTNKECCTENLIKNEIHIMIILQLQYLGYSLACYCSQIQSYHLLSLLERRHWHLLPTSSCWAKVPVWSQRCKISCYGKYRITQSGIQWNHSSAPLPNQTWEKVQSLFQAVGDPSHSCFAGSELCSETG